MVDVPNQPRNFKVIMTADSSSAQNFLKSLKNLERSVSTPITEPRDLSGILKDFEMVYELSWKVLKKLLNEQGHQTLGAKDVFSRAYQLGYLEEESVWLKMIEDRIHTAHVYDETEASRIVKKVIESYLPAFHKLKSNLGK